VRKRRSWEDRSFLIGAWKVVAPQPPHENGAVARRAWSDSWEEEILTRSAHVTVRGNRYARDRHRANTGVPPVSEWVRTHDAIVWLTSGSPLSAPIPGYGPHISKSELGQKVGSEAHVIFSFSFSFASIFCFSLFIIILNPNLNMSFTFESIIQIQTLV
jgi:hypothetical protein